MAGMDFSLLQPISPPRAGSVVAKLPDQPSGADSFAGGLQQGMQAGSNLATQMLAREKTKQDMAFDEKNNPLILQNNVEKVKQAGIKTQEDQRTLNAEKQTDVNAQKIQDAYNNGGMDAARKTMYSISVDAGQKFDINTADLQQKIATVAKTNADTDKQVLENGKQITTSLAQIASGASQIKDPQTQQKYINMQLENAPKAVQKAWAIAMPNGQLDPQMVTPMLALHGQQLIDDHKEANAKVSDKEIDTGALGKAQALTKENEAALTAAQQTGDPKAIKDATDQYNEAKQNEITLAQPKGQDTKPGPIEQGLGKEDAKAALAADNQQPALKTFKSDAGNALNLITTKIPKGYTGPIQGLIKFGFSNSDIQVLNHHVANMALLAKSVIAGQTMGMRLTNSELAMLQDIVGGKSVNWDANRSIFQDMIDKANVKAHDNWSVSNRVRVGGNAENYNTWKQANPEPYNPDKANEPSGYKHNGAPVPYAAFERSRVANPGMSDDDIAKKYQLSK